MVFIDGSNFHSTLKALNLDICYKRLHAYLSDQGVVQRIYYYTALDEGDYNPLKPLVDWMHYNGYHIVSKPVKTWKAPNGDVRRKGNMDVEMAVDMQSFADNYDTAFLFTGDGDFRYLVDKLQQLGKKVVVVSTKKTDPPIAADELRRQADEFRDLVEIKDNLVKK